MDYDNKLIETSNTLKLRGFTLKTQKTYMYNISRYFKFLEKTSLLPTKESAKTYLLYLNSKKYDSNTIRIASASILYFLREIQKENVTFLDIPKPKKKKQLPKVLSKEDVRKLLNNIKNKKHKLMISLLYSSGLRLSEFINLKRRDIDVNRELINVRLGKGQKDRITILSKKIKLSLMDYLCNNEFNTLYLFESQRKKKYSTKSIQEILKKASTNIHITPHMLRHSFATHLLETGTDIRYIQKLLGHQKLETTSIYTYVAKNSLENIKSPFDSV